MKHLKRSIVVLVFIFAVVPIIVSMSQGLFGGVEGFECWCRGDEAGAKTTSQTAMQLSGTPAIDNGGLTGNIWNITQATFPDANARIIWNAAGAASSAGTAPNALPIIFSKAYYNQSGSPMPVTVYAMVDDTADIFLNGTAIGSIVNCCVVKKFNLTLSPGNNVLSFAAKNLNTTNNPAGLLVTVVDAGNNVLFHTDNTWTFSNSSTIA